LSLSRSGCAIAAFLCAAILDVSARQTTFRVVRPVGVGVSVGVDHGGQTTWLKPSATRVVSLNEDLHQPGPIATSPLLRQALDPATPRRTMDPAAMVTWVWVLEVDPDPPVVTTTRPSIFVSYRDAEGINSGEWAPALIKLVPAGLSWQFVMALPGRADLETSRREDWKILPNLIQSTAPAAVVGKAEGMMDLVAKTPLEPGDYAVALRPVYGRLFVGRFVIGGIEDGAPFAAAWRFRIK
jgi:hypothetical protein